MKKVSIPEKLFKKPSFAKLFIWEYVDQHWEHKPKSFCIKAQRTFKVVVFCKKPCSSRFCCRHQEMSLEMTAEDDLVRFLEKFFKISKIWINLIPLNVLWD